MSEDFLNQFHKHKNPYRVPDDYFAGKKAELIGIATDKDKRPTRIITLKQGILWLSGVAAAVLIAVLLFPAQTNDTPPQPITDAMVEEYLLEEYPQTSLNDEMIMGEISDEALEDISFVELDDEALEDFIDENFDQTLHYEFL